MATKKGGVFASIRKTLLIAVIVAAVILKWKPEWCFKVPQVGWLLHAMVTGNQPPAYFSFDCYEPNEMKEWARDNDVIVSTLAKAGTTWMLYVSHLIRIRADENKFLFHEINTNTPWLSLLHSPTQKWKEIKPLYNTTILQEGIALKNLWDHPDYLFRVFKAHESPKDEEFAHNPSSVLPIKEFPKVKFLAMTRDLPDICASFFPFVKSHDESFRAMWGGFPPHFESPKQMLNFMFKGSDKNKKKKLGSAFLEYNKLWYKYRNEPNVLLLHYNDAIKDLKGTVKKIAKFYEINLSNKEIEAITSKASFSNMKKMQDKFNYRLWGNLDFRNGSGTCMVNGAVIRKGSNGDSKNLFTDDEIGEIRKFEDDFFQDNNELKEWSRNGGPLKD